jgi:exosortase
MVISEQSMASAAQKPGVAAFAQDLAGCWRRLPFKALFFALLAAWIGLFHFLGTSTLGYKNTPSLFGWLAYAYEMGGDDDISRYIPLIVLALYWWKRKTLLDLPLRHWWPGLALVGLALLMHTLGYFVQQSRISVVAFFVGLYGLTGLVWGRSWLKESLFPFALFALSMPLSSEVEQITFPLRLWATDITTALCGVFGIGVIQDGTRIFDSNGAYQYEVAAACSGIRSLTTTLLLAVIYAFVYFRGPGRRLTIIASAFPLAVGANVVRLTSIIIAAEAFGQQAGAYVHGSWWMSLVPYVPAFLGLGLLGSWLKEKPPGDKPGKPAEQEVGQPA